MEAIESALSGIPSWKIASAIAKSSNKKDIQFVIDKAESEAREARAMSGKRPDE